MHSVRVLWYLWWKQIVNGVKRAVSTPRRLISVLIGIGYYVGFFMRPWDNRTSGDIEKGFPSGFHLEPNIVNSVVFIVFTFFSFLLAMGVFASKNSFKQSDVDVLFPTPISSKVVMFFRLFRESIATLLFPLLIAVFAFQPAKGVFSAVKRNDPQALNYLIRGGLLAWLLMSIMWVAISYAMNFFIAKNEKKSRLILRSTGWIITIAFFAVFGYLGLQMRENPELSTFTDVTNTAWIRALMFIPTSATAVATGAFQGTPVIAILGASVLLGITVFSLVYSAKLSGWMYDQAATKGHQGQTLREYQRKGDYAAIFAEKARQGKIGQGRLAKRVAEWNFRKGWTLIYKEVLIQARIGFWSNFIFLLMIGGFGLMFLFLPEEKHGVRIGAYLYLGLTGFMAVNMSSIQSYSGFVETLRRVEVMKPLPLTSAQIAFFETAAKSVVAMFMSGSPYLIGMIYKPSLWQFHLSGMIAAPSLSLALTSAVFLIVVLFPDFDDPTQRSFRGIMQLIALVIIMMPTALIFIGLMYLGMSPLIPAVICLAVNFGITVLLTSITGRFYADFNPTE